MIQLNNYIILGIPRDATDADIEAGYKRMSIWAHPDKAGERNELAKLLMPLINNARDVLLDPVKRQEYDLRLLERERAVAEGRAKPRPTVEPHIVDPTPEELINNDVLAKATDLVSTIAKNAVQSAFTGLYEKATKSRRGKQR